MAAALAFCVAGFVIFAALAYYVAGSSRDGGVLPDGPSVRYAGVTQSDLTESRQETGVTKSAPSSDDEMVAVKDYAPSIRVELKYAGKKNITGRRLYDYHEAYLRYGTVRKLIRALTEHPLPRKSCGLSVPIRHMFRISQKAIRRIREGAPLM